MRVMRGKSDHGIVLCLDDHSPHKAYTDVLGTARTAGALTTSYQVGDDLLVGGVSRLLLACHVTLEGTGAASITLKIEGRVDDVDNSGVSGPAPIEGYPLGTRVYAAEHVLAAGDTLIACDDVPLTSKIVVSAKATSGTVKDGDALIVQARAT